MNWEAAGAIGEIVGAAAVVLTLAYLALQIRQSNKAARIAARLETTRQYADFLDGLLTDPDLARVFREGGEGQALNETDDDIFRRLMSKCFWYFSAHHFQYSLDALTETDWYQSRMLIARISSRPGVEAWWNENKEDFSSQFVAFMDAEIFKAG